MHIQRGELQQTDGLLQLRCERQLLGYPELEGGFHGLVLYMGAFALQLEVFAQIYFPYTLIINDFIRFAFCHYRAGIDDIGTIADA